MFAATLNAGKAERALDLVDRLNLEKSFDLAIKLADNHRKLADFIEEAKESKFNRIEDDDFEDSNPSPSKTFIDRLAPSRQISPDAGQTFKIKRTLGEEQQKMSKKVRLGE